jgi:transposase-like protein
VYVESRRDKVNRPRVRKRSEDGSTEEVSLNSYRAAQDRSEVHWLLIQSLLAAGSTRRVGKVVHNQLGSSRSEVSRMWREVGREKFSQLRHRSLTEDEEGKRRDWVVLMLDGVVLADDLVAVVAVGIMADGQKMVLDFELGGRENVETASALVSRLQQRGFATGGQRPLLVILDGSKALRKAVLAHYPDARIQRCLVHKERNLKRYLPRRHWEELHELFDRLRKAQGGVAALEVLQEIDAFLACNNQAAHDSLHEAGLDLIRVHLLDAPSTLHQSLLNTNIVENVILNIRHNSDRVKRWHPQTDQASRWLATGLLCAEEGFHRIAHYQDLGKLVAHLAIRRDEENLEKLRDRLPDWLLKELPPKQGGANRAPQASGSVDTEEKVEVGLAT